MNSPSDESLSELLQRLHERLTQSGRIDPASRELLSTVRRDIQQALGGTERDGSARAGGARIDRESALEVLEALEVRFEAEHPGIAQALRQLIDLLGKAGI